MTFNDISTRARQLLRDSNKTIFNETDIANGVNEGIDRTKQLIKELSCMQYLSDGGDVPIGLPEQYHHLLALYAASRCFFTDEQFQQSTILMNEYEAKMYDLRTDIENGDVVIKDADGNVVTSDSTNRIDGIKDVYFDDYQSDETNIKNDEVVITD